MLRAIPDMARVFWSRIFADGIYANYFRRKIYNPFMDARVSVRVARCRRPAGPRIRLGVELLAPTPRTLVISRGGSMMQAQSPRPPRSDRGRAWLIVCGPIGHFAYERDPPTYNHNRPDPPNSRSGPPGGRAIVLVCCSLVNTIEA